MPKPEPDQHDEAGAAAAGDDPTAPMVDGTAAARSLHPVFGDRQPPTAERFAWVAAYDRYNPGVVVWGNRARGADAWAAAVNAFSLNPANWHPTRRHDIGQFHGVNLHARLDDTTIEIEPRHAYAKNGTYPTYTAQPGRIDPTGLSMWLAAQRARRRHRTQRAPTPTSPPAATARQPAPAGPVRTMTTRQRQAKGATMTVTTNPHGDIR